VRRHRLFLLALLATAVPAAASSFGRSAGEPPACLGIGDINYRIAAAGERADYAVRLAPAAARPDIRIAFTDSSDEADFIFVEDAGQPRCPRGPSKSVRLDGDSPEITVGFAADADADYRIFVRSRTLSRETAAALYAAAQIPARRIAARKRLELSASR